MTPVDTDRADSAHCPATSRFPRRRVPSPSPKLDDWRQINQLGKKIERLLAAIETGGQIQSLTVRLRELEARREAIDAELRSARPLPTLPAEVIEDRLAEWRRLLRASTTQRRAVLQRVPRGRIVFTPSGEGYTFEAPTRFDKLFSGIVAPRPAFIEKSNKGWAHLRRTIRSSRSTVDYSKRFALNGVRPQNDRAGDTQESLSTLWGRPPRCLTSITALPAA